MYEVLKTENQSIAGQIQTRCTDTHKENKARANHF